jgi:hypothetical protein
MIQYVKRPTVIPERSMRVAVVSGYRGSIYI